MMNLSTQSYKGARDFYPEEMRLQNYIFSVWRNVCESFGYEEYLCPVLEPTEIYLAKTSEEIVREQTYTFKDRGDRTVTMRPEMTPSISRMVAAKRQELGYPARLYSIANFWRYERSQRGRLREFWQLNADIFGVEGIAAEHEGITMADQIVQAFGAKRNMYEIRINSRKFVNYVLKDYLGFDETETTTLVRLIDRIDKMTRAEFVALAEAAIRPSQREEGKLELLMNVLDASEIEELPEGVRNSSNLDDLKQLLGMLQSDGITNAKFNVRLMRGFDYYTDIVFEAFDTHPENNRSMFGGGRYDGLVGNFGVEPVPTFGFAPGDISTQLFLESHGLVPELKSPTELYMVLAGVEYPAVVKLLSDLRNEGVNVAVDTCNKKIGSQIKNAEKKGIQYVAVVGDQELSTQRFKLKNLKTGNEEELSFERLVTTLKDKRTK